MKDENLKKMFKIFRIFGEKKIVKLKRFIFTIFFVKKVQQKFRQIEGIQFHDFLCEKKINKSKISSN